MKTILLALAANLLSAAAFAGTYEAKGKYYETCDCKVSCKCASHAMPSEGKCDALNLFKLEKAAVGETRLDGLAFAIVFKSPEGQVVHEAWEKGELDYFALYLDDKATEAQRKVFPQLIELMVGKIGFAKARAPEYVPIQVVADQHNALIDIGGGKLLADLVTMKGEGEEPKVAWPFVTNLAQGRSNAFKYLNGETQWSYRGRNAFFGKFAVKGTWQEPVARR